MNNTIVTEYPIWLVLACILIAFLYAFFLYRRDKTLKDIGKWKIATLSVFRFAAVFILCFLLLSPFIKSEKITIENPIVIFAQDNSESVIINKDSIFYKEEYPQIVENFVTDLKQQFSTNTYTFGNELTKNLQFSYTDKQTDFTSLLGQIGNNYYKRNVGAIIISSDGIYNNGKNPIYSTDEINFPIYTIALGDTNPQKDIILSEVLYNKIAFLGNKFPVRSVVDINELKGTNTKIGIIHKNKTLFSKEILVTDNRFSVTIDAEIEANEKGLQRYKIVVSPNNHEISKKNNSQDIIIDVIDSKQKILIVANSAHPDIGALRKTLKLNENFELDYCPIDDLNQNVKDYNLLILHQLPSKTNAATTLLSEVFKNKIPCLFILGASSSTEKFNNLKIGLNIYQTKGATEETQAKINSKFPLFESNEESIQFFSKAPPLISPFGEYKTNPSANVLFYQKIKNINTQKPLILFNTHSENKIAVISGEGIWRWRLNDFLNNSNHNFFNEFINSVVQYLALSISKERFIVSYENLYSENENIIIRAEVYNESYELINSEDLEIEISDQNENKFNFIFDKTSKAYRLDAGLFPAGDYKFRATAEVSDEILTKEGKFSVLPVNIEAINSKANHQLLNQLAENNNGKMYFPQQISELQKDLENNNNIVPISHSEQKFIELINLKWIAFIILFLLSLEWFFRKYLGSY
ncbi:MAG: hypothetical protein HN704_03710 [Bacteroidetes bacterium]|nr:hypothetical protein [Bacteroidota bacterium]MBT6687742.1 hypothetical protein [Bacteroidota bacterium]MBT7143376.1 hypothetical protein [Bacteroidota bacterium]MBT7490698.1 hypothetical protein [Bacteroidota bacterium]